MGISVSSKKDHTTCKLLDECYQEATRKNGLIDFTKKVLGNNNRGKYSIKTTDLSNLFSAKIWDERKTGNGHRKIQNKITGVMIEYKNHELDLDPGSAESIYKAVQKHLNVLGNDIFKYTHKNWKTAPDLDASVVRFKMPPKK